MKTRAPSGDGEPALRGTQRLPWRICGPGFQPLHPELVPEERPEVIRGQLARSFVVSDYEVEYAGTTRVPGYQKFLLENLLLNFLSRPHFIAYETNHATNARLRSLRNLGVPLLGWTIREKAEYEEAKGRFDNLIVDAVLFAMAGEPGIRGLKN